MKKHNKKEKQYTEILHKEIDLIQSCIERMSRNSFSCKGWNLTLQAGIFALFPDDVNKCHLCIIALGIDLFF